MDEIAAVTGFRDAIPTGDAAVRNAARGALAAAMQTPAAPRRRRRRVGLVAIAAALVAVVAVSSALGWTHRLVELVAGEPAPPSVKEAFAVHNDAFGRKAFPIFRRGVAGEAIVARAHGVLGIESSVGPIYIWAAPTRGGGLCWTLDVVRFRLPDGRPSGGGMCGAYPERHPAWITGGMTKSLVQPGTYLTLVEGRVRDGVARVELRYDDGSADVLPIFEGFVLAEPQTGATPVALVALDGEGHELRSQILRDPLTASRHHMPEPTGPERTLFSFDTAAGFPLTFSVAPAEHGKICTTILYRGGSSRGCGPDQRTRVGRDQMRISPGLQNESGDGNALITLHGVVGTDVASVQLRFEDGTTEPMPIVEQFVFAEVPPANHWDKRFTVIGRDRAGKIVARRVIASPSA